MKKLYLLLCVLGLIAASCATETSFYTHGRNHNLTVSTNVTPMAADLDVSSERITFEANYTKKKNKHMDVNTAKSTAVADLLAKYNADVLVAPLAKVTENKKNIHVVVSGYPATYTNFRKASTQELEMRQAASKKEKRQ